MINAWHEVEALEPRLMLDSGPIVTAITINDGNAQRSILASLAVEFDRDVGFSISVDDLVLTRTDMGASVDLNGASLSYDQNSMTATWGLAGLPADRIDDGFYTATLMAAGISADGYLLDGNRDGVVGDDYSFGLFRMGGDANGDGVVNAVDLTIVQDNFLKPPGTFQGNADLNADNEVNIFDLRAVRQGWQEKLEPPEPLDRATTVAEVAAALYYSPERMFEHVLNNFRYEPYAGQMKGPQATIATRSGNAWDQAGLLLSLLDQAGVYSRFITAQVQAEAQLVSDWLGTKGADAAASVLANAGLHPTSILNGGQITSIRFDQTWVESYLPDSGGTRQWTDLDPSWKFRDFKPGLAGLISLVPFDESGYLSQDPQVVKDLPYEYYEDQVAAYLAANSPGTSLADVPYDGPIIPRAIADLSAETLPYGIEGATSHYTQVPASMTHRVRVRLEDDYGFTTYLDELLSMPQSSLKRVTVSYASAGGSQLRPQLRLDGQVVQESPYTVADGAGVMLYIDHLDGDGDDSVDPPSRSYDLSAGDYLAIGLDAGQISQAMLDSQQKDINTAAIAAINGDPYDRDDQIGALLARSVLGYFYETRLAERRICGLTEGIPIYSRVASGITSSGTTVSYFPELQNPYLPDTMGLDVPNAVFDSVSLDGDEAAEVDRRLIALHNKSAQEHAIWEEVVQTESVSTIKCLQVANQRGIPVYVFDNSYGASQIRSLLNLSTSMEDDIVNRVVYNGQKVTIPRDMTPLNDWDGIGYIAEQDFGGGEYEWAYIISGGLNGAGETATQGGFVTSLLPLLFPFIPLWPLQFFVNDPINIANGNVSHEELDVKLPAVGIDLEFTRKYNTTVTDDVGFGPGWTHSYSDFLAFYGDTVVWTDSAGMRFQFDSDDGGGYIVPESLHGMFSSDSGQWVYRNRDGMTRVFDADGKLIAIRDRSDNAVSLTYDINDNLSAVIDADVPTRRLTFTWAAGRISAVSDFTGRTWTYAYEGGILGSVTTPSDAATPAYVTQYEYYTDTARAGLLRQVVRPDGGVVQFNYHADRRGYEVINPEGYAAQVSYNTYRGQAVYTDERGDSTTYVYNDRGNLIEQIHPNGATESWVWQDSLMKSHTDPFGQTTTYSHDSMGNVTQVVDRAGETSSFTYDPAFSQLTFASLPGGRNTTVTIDAYGNITEIQDALGGVSEMTYDPRGLMLTSTTPLGTATVTPGDYTATYTYNDAGRMLSRSSDLPATESFTYDTRGNLLTATDANGNTTSYTYDLLNRNLVSTDALGNVTSTVYAPLAGPASVTDPLGRTTTFEYDLNLQPVRVAAPDHSVTAAAYDGLGNVISQTDPLGRLTQYVYDDRGRLSTTMFADSAVELAHYDGGGRRTASVDPLGNTTSYAYDAMDRLVGITDAMGYVTTMDYDAVGNLVGITDANGNTTDYDYDLLDRRTTVTDALGNVTTMTYDADGNAESVTDPLGRVTEYAYDVAGRRTTVTDPLAHTTTTAYDPAGNVVSVTDALGSVTAYVYDAVNRTVRTTDALGAVTDAAYDAAGQLLSITDPVGNVTGYAYDAASRVLAETDPLGAVTQYSYDLAGNRVFQIDRNGREIDYTYDARDRLVEEAWYDDGGSPIRTIERTYDSAGQMTRLIDPDTDYQYVYDALGRVIEVTDTIVGLEIGTGPETYEGRLESGDWTLNEDRYLDVYEFEAELGAELSIGATSGDMDLWLILFRPGGSALQDWGSGSVLIETTADETGTWTVWVSSDLGGFPEGDYSLTIDSGQTMSGVVLEYGYDAVGNLASMSDNLGGANAYTYDAVNRLTFLTQSGTDVAEKRVDFTYNAAGQMDTVSRYANLAGTLPVVDTEYGYDGAGRLTALTHAQGGTTVTGYTWDFDAADRITQMTSTVDGVSDFTYDDIDQLTVADHDYQVDESYGYDANGNRTNTGYDTGAGNRLLSDGTYTYEYDAQGNRTLRTNIATGETTEYTWDHRNRLARVVEKDAVGTIVTDSQYAYDALGRRLTKTVDTDGAGPAEATVERFVYDGLHIAIVFDGAGVVKDRYIYGPGIDMVIAQQGATGTVLWALADHQGTVRDLADSAGAAVNHIQYDSFGQITTQTAPGTDIRFAYTGREFDAETGLYNYRLRYYDPFTGRFVSEDPIALASGDTNMYRYVRNAPVVFVDPTGTFSSTPFSSDDFLSDLLEGRYFGTTYGEEALAWYASIIVNPDSSWYQVGGAYVGGFFAALWTPSTWGYTSSVLALGWGLAGWAARTGPWIGTAGFHGAHHGLGYHFEVILRVGGGKTFKFIVPGKDVLFWWGIK